jgi:hypothetical protein
MTAVEQNDQGSSTKKTASLGGNKTRRAEGESRGKERNLEKRQHRGKNLFEFHPQQDQIVTGSRNNDQVHALGRLALLGQDIKTEDKRFNNDAGVVADCDLGLHYLCHPVLAHKRQ